MVRRRVIALAELVANALVLYLLVRFRGRLDRNEGPVPILPSRVAFGVVGGAAYMWAYDRDVADIRTDVRRRVLVQLGFEAAWRVLRRSFPDSTASRYSVALGGLFGSVAYRLWYGLLHPLPRRGS